jgi:putative membrane protein
LSLVKRLSSAQAVVIWALLPLAPINGPASARGNHPPASISANTELYPVDYDFVAQANLGASFQIDSGRIAERKATTADLRHYAHLMVITHVPVVDALNKILQRKGIQAPPNTLLHGAYSAMIASLNSERGAALDRDYVTGQVEYQRGNAALFRNEIRNGHDPDLKEFARQTLPKIEDHLKRALRLSKEEKLAVTCSKC